MAKPRKHVATNIRVVYSGTSKVIRYDDGSVPVNGNLRAKKNGNQRLTWTCARPFRIEIEDYAPIPSGNQYPAAFEPTYSSGSPFAGSQPYVASPNPTGGGYALTLTVKGNAQEGEYKYSVTVIEEGGGEVVDDPRIIID